MKHIAIDGKAVRVATKKCENGNIPYVISAFIYPVAAVHGSFQEKYYREQKSSTGQRAEYNPYETMTEKEILAKLKRSREHCEEGRYREAGQVVSDLRGKYGL